MANYVSASTYVHGPMETLREFLEQATSEPTGEILIISLGGLHHEYDRDVARLWECHPETILKLKEQTEEYKFISYGYECAWGAPMELTKAQSEKYPDCLFIISHDSMENGGVGVSAYVGGEAIIDEYEDYDEFRSEDEDEDEWGEPDYDAINSWQEERIEWAKNLYEKSPCQES